MMKKLKLITIYVNGVLNVLQKMRYVVIYGTQQYGNSKMSLHQQ